MTDDERELKIRKIDEELSALYNREEELYAAIDENQQRQQILFIERMDLVYAPLDKKRAEEPYEYHHFETEPIGRGNPYNRCVECGRSVPEINGRPEGHYKDCKHYKAPRK